MVLFSSDNLTGSHSGNNSETFCKLNIISYTENSHNLVYHPTWLDSIDLNAKRQFLTALPWFSLADASACLVLMCVIHSVGSKMYLPNWMILPKHWGMVITFKSAPQAIYITMCTMHLPSNFLNIGFSFCCRRPATLRVIVQNWSCLATFFDEVWNYMPV